MVAWTNSCEIGIKADGGAFISLIPRNAPLPAHGRAEVTTVADGQPSVEVAVVQRVDPTSGVGVIVGTFLLEGIYSAPAGVPRVEVRALLNSDGVIRVDARDIDTGAGEGIVVRSHEEIRDAQDEVKDLQKQLRRWLLESTDSRLADFSVLADADVTAGGGDDLKEALRIALDEVREAAYAPGSLQDT